MKYLKFNYSDLGYYFLAILIIFIPTLLPFFIHGYKTNLTGFLFLSIISFCIIIAIRLPRIWLLPLVFISITYSIYIIFTGEEAGFHVIGSIFETNTREAVELILSPAVIKLIIIALFITALITSFILRRSKKAASCPNLKINLIYLLLTPLTVYVFSLFLYQYGFRWTGVYPFNISDKVMKYYVVSKQASLFRKNMMNFSLQEDTPTNQNAITGVFVIGEAARIHSMSLYGYHKNTTPNFDKLDSALAGTRFFTFLNVLPAGPFTRVSVPSMLSISGVRSFTSIHKYPSFIKLFSALGFETYLISNQPSKGINNNMADAFYADIKHRLYLNEISTQSKYDIEILPIFKDYLEDTSKQKLIIIHLSGSHIDYQHRYPESHNYFNTDLLLDTYDNSIRYTDYILQKLITQLETLDSPAFLTYCSDHGENLNDSLDNNYGHGTKDFTKFEMQIPLNIWVNDQYAHKHASQLSRLADHQQSLISHDNISHTLLGMADLFPYEYQPNMDISSIEFLEKTRYIMDRDSRIYKAKEALPWLNIKQNQ